MVIAQNSFLLGYSKKQIPDGIGHEKVNEAKQLWRIKEERAVVGREAFSMLCRVDTYESRIIEEEASDFRVIWRKF